MKRVFWFVLGAATAGLAIAKGRDVAYRFTTQGIIDQVGAAGVGWRTFKHEMHQGKQLAEERVLTELFAAPDMKELN